MPAPVQLLVIVLAMVAFWAIVMRPARNQQRQVAGVQQSLAVGEQVVLSSGIFGTIRALGEQRVELEVAAGTVITVARQVVVRRVEDAPELEEPSDYSELSEPETPSGSSAEDPTTPEWPERPEARD